MSHEIVKSIKIDKKNKKVFITSHSNNVVPAYNHTWHATFFDDFFELGIEEVQKEILYGFWQRSFQGQSTSYGKFYNYHFDNKKGYTWDNVGKVKGEKLYDWDDRIAEHTYDELKNDLFNQYQEFLKLSSKKNLLFVRLGSQYIMKLTSRRTRLTNHKEYASKFTLAKVEEIRKRFNHYDVNIEAAI
jgi:hypothetical protein